VASALVLARGDQTRGVYPEEWGTGTPLTAPLT
jgi:hypothetical protein